MSCLPLPLECWSDHRNRHYTLIQTICCCTPITSVLPSSYPRMPHLGSLPTAPFQVFPHGGSCVSPTAWLYQGSFVLSSLECVLLSAAWCMLVPPPSLSQLPHSRAVSPSSCLFQDRILLCPGRILLLGQGAVVCLLWEPSAIGPLPFLSKGSLPEYHCHAVLSLVLWASFQMVSSQLPAGLKFLCLI